MPDLDEYRAELNQTDDAILRFFLHRMQIAKQIGAYKQMKHLQIVQPKREETILTRLCTQAPLQFQANTNLLFSLLMQLSRSAQFMDCIPSEPPKTSSQPWIETMIIHGKNCTDSLQKIALCAFSYALTLKKIELLHTSDCDFHVLFTCEIHSAQSLKAFCAELTQIGYDIQKSF